MTNQQRASANDTPRPTPRPVTLDENREVDGNALCMKSIIEEKTQKTNELRDQQQEYYNSLPTDPQEALTHIQRTLSGTGSELDESYAPRAALAILEELLWKEDFSDVQAIKEPLRWLVGQGLKGLDIVDQRAKTAYDTAEKLSPRHRPFEA